MSSKIMLREIESVRQIQGDPDRRWFNSEDIPRTGSV